MMIVTLFNNSDLLVYGSCYRSVRTNPIYRYLQSTVRTPGHLNPSHRELRSLAARLALLSSAWHGALRPTPRRLLSPARLGVPSACLACRAASVRFRAHGEAGVATS